MIECTLWQQALGGYQTSVVQQVQHHLDLFSDDEDGEGGEEFVSKYGNLKHFKLYHMQQLALCSEALRQHLLYHMGYHGYISDLNFQCVSHVYLVSISHLPCVAIFFLSSLSSSSTRSTNCCNSCASRVFCSGVLSAEHKTTM